MAELSVSEVSTFTGGRLAADSEETARLLAMALWAAREYCGWHVYPVKAADPFKLDGPGSPVLRLPTLKLISVDSLLEEGVAVDVATAIDVSEGGRVERRGYGWWSSRLGSIAGTMTHGHAAAPGFDQAVLTLLDRASYAPEGGRAKVIGPIQYETGAMGRSVFTLEEQGYLDGFRIENRP